MMQISCQLQRDTVRGEQIIFNKMQIFILQIIVILIRKIHKQCTLNKFDNLGVNRQDCRNADNPAT